MFFADSATGRGNITKKYAPVVMALESFCPSAIGFIAHDVAVRGFLVWKFVRSAKALEKSGLIDF